MQQFSREQSLTMTIKIDYRKLSSEQKKFYKDWIYLNISKAGKIWAIDGDQLIWANAFVTDYSQTYSNEKNFASIDLDFNLYEGVWHKADSRKTFLKEYNTCDFADCLDFREQYECLDCCVSCSLPKDETCRKCECECETLQVENSLCELKKEIAKNFYARCGETYQIVYNCEAGKHLWSEEKLLGEKLCKEDTCKNLIAGQFYSSTVLDSESVTITLSGTFKDPEITINGNTMIVLGEYSGVLTITESGDIYYKKDECCDEKLIGVDNLKIPQGSTFGFIVHQGMNSVIVETNNCCDMSCMYVKVDNITL
jgi:hypothetical protein